MKAQVNGISANIKFKVSALLAGALLVLAAIPIQAAPPDTYEYTYTFGDTGNYEYTYGVTTDSDNNVYTVGTFSDTVDFDPAAATDEHTSSGGGDIYLTKINEDSTYEFTKSFGGSGSDAGRDVLVDGSGNIYVAGSFTSTDADFDPGPGSDGHVSSGSYDTFLTKFNADGSYNYTKSFGSTGYDFIYSMTLDSNDNIYLVGRFEGTVDFDSSIDVDEHTSNGSADIFLTKINADGSYGYTKTMGSSSSDWARDVTVDSSNNIYLTGTFRSTVDFDPGPGTDEYTSNGVYDIFLTKINSEGSYDGTTTIGGTNSESGAGLTFDAQGNLYLAGEFRETVDFDPGPNSDEFTVVDAEDLFITKFKADGSYAYTQTMGGVGYEEIANIVADSNDNIFIAGTFAGTNDEGPVDFNPHEGTDEHTSNGREDIFFTKINADGSYGYTATLGSGAWDHGHALAIDKNNNVYLAGDFSAALDFDPSENVDSYSPSGAYDGFLTKFSADDDSDSTDLTIENNAPNNGDANNDGALDSTQANVSSIVGQNDNYIAVEVGTHCPVASLENTGETEVDADYDYPAGLINFELSCFEAGVTTTVTQYFYGINGSDFTLRKYNPNTAIYTVIEEATITSGTIGGESVVIATYNVTDGGELDLDGEVNGAIIDPVGLATEVVDNGLGDSEGGQLSAPETGLELQSIHFNYLLVMIGVVANIWSIKTLRTSSV